MSQLPAECLEEILEYFDDDKNLFKSTLKIFSSSFKILLLNDIDVTFFF